jgi:hypothetical protein
LGQCDEAVVPPGGWEPSFIAVGLLVDDLDYPNHDVVLWVTMRILMLTGGRTSATRRPMPAERRGPSPAPTAAARRPPGNSSLGAYLEHVELADLAVETVREHVRSMRLSEILTPRCGPEEARPQPATPRCRNDLRHPLASLGPQPRLRAGSLNARGGAGSTKEAMADLDHQADV